MMSMKRISVLCFQGLYTLPTIIVLSIFAGGFALFFGLVVRLIISFHPQDSTLTFTPPQFFMWLEMLTLMFAGMAGIGFITLMRSEKTNETAELLFATPISAKEYILSLWFVSIFSCIVGIYVTIGVYVFSAGVHHLAIVSPFIWWLRPLPMATTWASAGGLLGIILILESSLIKKAVYGVIIFMPLLIVIVWVGISEFVAPMGIMVDELLPAWVLVVPSSSHPHLHLGVWFVTAIYMLLWFFLLIRKIDVRSFIYPVRSSLSIKWEEM